MSDQYKTVRRQGLYELTDRGSRFIGLCEPILSEQDALDLINSSRVRYPEARHYVYAWRTNLPCQLQRFSDDGEPHGTGGRQVLDALLQEEIDRAAIVVVRYFGGILLGKGGLSRAYSKAARGALEAALPVRFVRCQSFRLEADYPVFHQLQGRLEAGGFFLEPAIFGERVEQLVGATADRVEELRALVMNLSSGQIAFKPEAERWLEDPS